MNEKLQIRNYIRSSSVNVGIVINVVYMLHHFKFFAVGARNKNFVTIINNCFNQFFSEAIYIIVIICKQSN